MLAWAGILDEGVRVVDARTAATGNIVLTAGGAGLTWQDLVAFTERLRALGSCLLPGPGPVVPRGGLFIISSARHAPRWRTFPMCGIPVTATWPDRLPAECRGGDVCLESAPDTWEDELRRSAACLVYTAGDRLEGSLAQVGAALALRLPLVWCDVAEPVNPRYSPPPPLTTQYAIAAHPGVRVVATMNEALAVLAAVTHAYRFRAGELRGDALEVSRVRPAADAARPFRLQARVLGALPRLIAREPRLKRGARS
jgi:hypothetical protein